VPVLSSPVIAVKPRTLPEVVAQLDVIINWAIQHKNRIGYFASLYKHMTVAVQNGIINKRFQDGPRMEQLDVIFANRYLDAWRSYPDKQPFSSSLFYALHSCNNSGLIVLQHLLLGMNTHINLDLGIAAAETAEGSDIYELQRDFEMINDIISETSQYVQDCLAKVWFPLKFINRIANKHDDAVINFSIKNARQAAWANAVALSLVKGQARLHHISFVDNSVLSVARKIASPGFYTRSLLQPVLMMEHKNVAKIIGMLQ